jgi:hypothetical protein
MATLKNTIINDTGHITVPSGTTGERPASPVVGMLRYNTTNNTLETYTSSSVWGGLEPPPTVSGISGTINVDTDSTITITGTNFVSGAIITISGAGVSSVDRTLTTTYVSATTLTAATNATAVNYIGGAAWSYKVTNPSGNQSGVTSGGTIDRDPTWTTASGSLGTVFDNSRTASFTVVATDPDGSAITSYAITSGAVPTGMSLNTSTGVISGTASAVGTDTTSTFSIQPTSNSFTGAARSFSILVKAPVVTSYTATGSNTFSVPSGVTSLQVLVVAGGGSGSNGDGEGGGGGAGGYIEMPSYPATPGGSIPLSVGAGATIPGTGRTSADGTNSVFGALTAIGGGGGGSWQGGAGRAGGSGGGGGADSGGAGPASQPVQPGNSGTYGYGYPGGSAGSRTSAGGGGAGAVGQPAPAGAGGAGRTSSITGSPVYRAGGGGGTNGPASGVSGPGGTGGGGRGSYSGATGQPGTTNTGGGGGGGHNDAPTTGGSGAPGIIIVKY